MNKLKLFKSIYFIFLLLFGNKHISCATNDPQKVVVDDVEILEVGLAKTVHCIDYNKKTVLQCKPKHVLVVHAAQWSNATCEQKKTTDTENTYKYFNRTEALQQLCDGLSYCFLRPSRTRDDHYSTFLGDPIVYHKLPNTHSTNNYSLTVSVSCLNRDLSVKGRKVTDTFNSKENNVDFGCNEDEVIHLSVTRVDGYSEDGPNRLLKQYNYGPHVFDCNLKQKCTVTSEHLKKSESNNFVFGTGVLVYYCRKPMKFSFCDHVVVTEDTANQNQTPYDKFVLYAEQDSQVTVKPPIFYVLKVDSAIWSTPDKLTDESVKKDRTDLVKFLCEDRNYCAFTPKRSAAGAVDTSYEEVHFGGILSDDKPLVLLATFTTKHVKDLNESKPTGLKTQTTPLYEKLSLECKEGEEGTLHILSAIGGPTSKTNPNSVDKSDLNSVKFKDLTKVLHKICYRKRKCEWNLNPIPLNQAGGGNRARTTTTSPSNLQLASMLELSLLETTSQKAAAAKATPANTAEQAAQAAKEIKLKNLPAGLKDQEITIKYVCKKYTHDPSLVDSVQQPAALLQMSDDPQAHTSLAGKEQAQTVSLGKKTRLFINLEVFSDCTVTVGDFFTVKVPNLATANGTAEVYFNNNQDAKFSQALEGKPNKFVLYLYFTDESGVDFAMNVSDGVTEKNYTKKLSAKENLTYPINLKDVVKASGGVVGMRVYLAPR